MSGSTFCGNIICRNNDYDKKSGLNHGKCLHGSICVDADGQCDYQCYFIGQVERPAKFRVNKPPIMPWHRYIYSQKMALLNGEFINFKPKCDLKSNNYCDHILNKNNGKCDFESCPLNVEPLENIKRLKPVEE